MSQNTSRVTIDAEPEKVWLAITRPDLVKKWQYGSDLITTWGVGESIVFRTEWQGQIFEQYGKVLEFEPVTRLSYSLFAPRPGRADIPENYFTMVYQIEKVEGGTLLSITQIDNRRVENENSESTEENGVLKALKALVEAGVASVVC